MSVAPNRVTDASRCRTRTQRRSAESARGRAEQFRPEHSPKPCPPFIITPSTSVGQLDVCLESVDYPQDVESPVPGQARAQGSQLKQSIDHRAKKNVAPCVAARGLTGVVR